MAKRFLLTTALITALLVSVSFIEANIAYFTNTHMSYWVIIKWAVCVPTPLWIVMALFIAALME